MSRENFCTRIHHFDQWWDSQFLKAQLDSKWKNSSFSGKKTSTSFQRAISRPIPTPGRHSKMVYKQLDAFLHQDLPVLTSVGKINFLRIKWTPNDKIQIFLESRLPQLSNEPSRTPLWHQEGPQNELQTWATCLGFGATCLGRFLQRLPSSARRACRWARRACRWPPDHTTGRPDKFFLAWRVFSKGCRATIQGI